jgi:hypothetical protein
MFMNPTAQSLDKTGFELNPMFKIQKRCKAMNEARLKTERRWLGRATSPCQQDLRHNVEHHVRSPPPDGHPPSQESTGAEESGAPPEGANNEAPERSPASSVLSAKLGESEHFLCLVF